MLPYSTQSVDESDIEAVVRVLKSDRLTTGPEVRGFELDIETFCGVEHAVAVSNGTAALHAAVCAAGLGEGDEVIVPPITFVASANAAVYQGARPVFADVSADTLLLDPEKLERSITDRTRAIISVDFAGQPCDYRQIRDIASRHGLMVIADASHALGAQRDGESVGGMADMTTFSFHPVKPITCGEGGMVTTDDSRLADRLRLFRNHGIASDARAREQAGDYYYEMSELGHNFRLSDIHCALGRSQLRRLPAWQARREVIASAYGEAFSQHEEIAPLARDEDVTHAWHLYVVRVPADRRDNTFRKLRAQGIGVNVHYIPVHTHPYYREQFQTSPGDCPVAEEAYSRLLSLPLYPDMTDDDVDRVVNALVGAIEC